MFDNPILYKCCLFICEMNYILDLYLDIYIYIRKQNKIFYLELVRSLKFNGNLIIIL